MKIRCIAIDDEPLALNKLKRNILKFPYLELVAACHNAEQAKRILQTMEVDLIYIDINIPPLLVMDGHRRNFKADPSEIYLPNG